MTWNAIVYLEGEVIGVVESIDVDLDLPDLSDFDEDS